MSDCRIRSRSCSLCFDQEDGERLRISKSLTVPFSPLSPRAKLHRQAENLRSRCWESGTESIQYCPRFLSNSNCIKDGLAKGRHHRGIERGIRWPVGSSG